MDNDNYSVGNWSELRFGLKSSTGHILDVGWTVEKQVVAQLSLPSPPPQQLYPLPSLPLIQHPALSLQTEQNMEGI